MFSIAFRKAEDQIPELFSKLDSIEANKTEIFAADGKTKLFSASGVYRKIIENYDEIPETVINSTLAAEDKRFFDHDGVDFIAAVRSTVVNILAHDTKQGGSTISMQLAKRLFTSPARTFERKLNDAALALQMENLLTKKEILRTYLNQIFYGRGAHGIKAAAEVYFGKDLKDLTIAEAALLARCVRRPSDENPFDNLEAAINNRNVVLKIMREEKMITEQQYQQAIKEPVKLQKKSIAGGRRVLKYPYATYYVLDYLKKNYPEIDIDNGGYRIETTIDPQMQEVIEQEIRNIVQRNKRYKVSTGAFVLLSSDGAVLGMAGGVDFNRNQFNVAYQGGRQPGSSFKPFVYAAALSTGAISSTTYISNEPLKWGDYSPGGGKLGGSYSIPDALAQSKNVPAVRVTQMVGPDVAADYAKTAFGFQSKIQPFRSMALGTNDVTLLEMAAAYSVFQSKGNRVTPYPVTRIMDSSNRVIVNFTGKIYKNQLDPSVAGYIDQCLRYVVTNGTGREARAVHDSHGKTGTTQENKDAWFCGYTNNLIGVGWISNEIKRKDGSWANIPMGSYVMGGTVTVDLWRNVMLKAQKKYGRGTTITAPPLNADIPVNASGRPKEPSDNIAPEPTNQDERGEPTETTPVNEQPPTTKPKNDPPKRDTETENQQNEGATTTVDICADTGMRATAYCPETNSREVSVKRMPKYCTRHKAP